MGRPASGSVRRLSGRWQARVSHLGRQVALGTYSTRQEALDAIAQARSDATRGRFVVPMGSRTCVEAVVEAWWQTRAGYRASTRARDRMVLDHDVLPEFGQARLVEVTHEEVQAWVNLLAKRLAPSSVQRSFTVLRQVLDVAVDSGLLAANPASRVRRPRPQRFEAHFLTPDELELLASSIAPRYRAMVLVMAWGSAFVYGHSPCWGDHRLWYHGLALVEPSASTYGRKIGGPNGTIPAVSFRSQCPDSIAPLGNRGPAAITAPLAVRPICPR